MIKNKDIYRRALRLAVPMMIQNGITNMVGLVDNVMVGSLGSEAITAVSIVGQLIFVFNLAIFGGLSGPGIYGAQYFGSKNMNGFQNTVRLKHWIGLVCLAGGLIVFTAAGEPLIGLYLRGESDNVDPVLTMSLAKQYMSIMLWGLPFFVFTQIYSTSLRETGESVKPMVAAVTSVVVDVMFNYVFIYGNFGAPKLGVQGAAIATVMARMIEMCVVVIWAFAARGRHVFLKGLYKTLLVPLNEAKKILKKSVPIFFNEFLWAGGLAVLTQCYSLRSLDIVAGLNISNALCNLFNVVFVAMGNAVGILTGQTLGASEYEKARKDSFSLMWFTGIVCLILTAALVGVSGIFPMFYNTTDEIRGYASGFIVITALFFPVQGFLNALYFTLRSGGKTLITFLFDSVFSWVIPVPCAFLLCNFTELPVFAVYAVVQAADLIKVGVGSILIKKGVWVSNLVEETAN